MQNSEESIWSACMRRQYIQSQHTVLQLNTAPPRSDFLCITRSPLPREEIWRKKKKSRILLRKKLATPCFSPHLRIEPGRRGQPGGKLRASHRTSPKWCSYRICWDPSSSGFDRLPPVPSSNHFREILIILDIETKIWPTNMTVKPQRAKQGDKSAEGLRELSEKG